MRWPIIAREVQLHEVTCLVENLRRFTPLVEEDSINEAFMRRSYQCVGNNLIYIKKPLHFPLQQPLQLP